MTPRTSIICASLSRATTCCAKSNTFFRWRRQDRQDATRVDALGLLAFNPAMQIESLKVFCDLAETESFTKAAQINHVTQSAVSQQISSLERQFKSLLIERSKKKFRLTREGQVLYEYSKQIIQTFEALHSRLQEIKDIISGTIRVATIYSIGLHDLPPYIKRFLK